VVATTVGLASVVVKAYSSAPQTLLNIFRHLFDFTYAFLDASWNLSFILLSFIFNISSYFLWCFTGILPCLLSLFSTACSFVLWMTVHLARGLLGLENDAVNAFSWLIALCTMYLYFENKYRSVLENYNLNGQFHLFTIFARQMDNNIHMNLNNNMPDLMEAADIDPDQQEENLQLEIENRENENEENALEEADRNRVNIDNVQNDQRELDRAEQALPQFHFPDNDSSDDEIDPNMCSVCLHRVRGAALFPCGHTQLCRVCARIIIAAQRPCPMCQTPIEEYRNVYL